MKELKDNLNSENPEIQSQACLDLISFIDDAKSILASKIQDPQNRGYTGTMIHALSYLNCEDLAIPLMSALISGSFETANAAYIIFMQQEFEFSEDDEKEIKTLIKKYASAVDESDFSVERKEMIQDVIQTHFSVTSCCDSATKEICSSGDK